MTAQQEIESEKRYYRALHRLYYGTWYTRLYWRLRSIWVYDILHRRPVLSRFEVPKK